MAEEHAQVFDIRKIYLKDSSLESPNAPGVFLEDPAQPDVSIEATIKTNALEQEQFYEVILGLTLTAKIGDKTGFLVEVMQAGVFQISGLEKKELPFALEIACPNVLLPFAREAISDLVGKAGFPQLLISPINFETLFQQKQAKIKQAAEEAAKAKADGQEQ